MHVWKSVLCAISNHVTYRFHLEIIFKCAFAMILLPHCKYIGLDDNRWT